MKWLWLGLGVSGVYLLYVALKNLPTTGPDYMAQVVKALRELATQVAPPSLPAPETSERAEYALALPEREIASSLPPEFHIQPGDSQEVAEAKITRYQRFIRRVRQILAEWLARGIYLSDEEATVMALDEYALTRELG